MGTSGWQGSGKRRPRRLPSNTDIDAVADAFYDAAGDESLIEEATRRAGDCLNAKNTVLFVRPGKFTEPPSLFVPINVEQSSIEAYTEYFYQRDLWTIGGEERPRSIGTVMLGEDLVDSDRLKNSEFYADYLKPLDMPQLLTGIVERSPTTVVNISFLRGHSQPVFAEAELRALEALQPVIRTATRSLLLLRKLSAQTEAVLETIMKIGQAVVLINARGEVIHVNNAAARLFQRSNALRIDKRRLTAQRRGEKLAIERLVEAAKRPGQGHEPVAVYDETGQEVYALTAIPLRVAERAQFGTDDPEVPAVALVIATTDSLLPPDAAILKQAFGLTAAQARVARMLAIGTTLVEIATTLAITHETARSHLKQAMQKTGTTHQAQFVRKVLGISGNISEP